MIVGTIIASWFDTKRVRDQRLGAFASRERANRHDDRFMLQSGGRDRSQQRREKSMVAQTCCGDTKFATIASTRAR